METKPLKIQLYGSPILRKKCRKIERPTPEVNRLLDEMVLLMRKNRGVGLAANQAGLDLSAVVVEAEDKLYRLLNPRITKKGGRILFNEGCLSFPGLELCIPRAEELWLDYMDEQGRSLSLKAQGMLAVILQHELDHINGVLFIDKVSFLMRLKIARKLREIKKSRSSYGQMFE